jgi:polar amino acid transport system permease protein
VVREFGLHDAWFLVESARWTILLTLIAFVGGGAVGSAIALLRIARSSVLRAIAIAYIKLFQGTPLLMQLYLVFFGANLFGIGTDPWVAVALALTLYASAFLGEIWRGCIQAVPRGQWEGAQALALGYTQQLRLVVLPQALRIAVPPTVGFLVQLLKSTSLASIIGFTELTMTAQMLNNATFRPFTVYALVAAIYFALCWPLSVLSQNLERRLTREHLPAIARPSNLAP